MPRYIIAILSALLLLTATTGCSGEKKITRYESIYAERPLTVYVAPLFDLTPHKSDADSATLASYAITDSVAPHILSIIPIALRQRGYTPMSQDTVLRPSAAHLKRLRALNDGNLYPYCQQKQADAVLITTLLAYRHHHTEPRLFVEFHLRSTTSGVTLMHRWVQIERVMDTTWKGKPLLLPDDYRLADTLHLTPLCAARSMMLEQATLVVLQDLPFTERTYPYRKDLYLPAAENYIKLEITVDGFVEVGKMTMEEFENNCFF